MALGAVVVALVVAGTLAATLPSALRSPNAPARRAGARPASHRHRQAGGPATFPGPDGVEARWVVTENAKPGTTAWRITAPQRAGGIDGYASAVQATGGQRVTLFVSTSAPTFQVMAYRMGYYGGAGARLVWQSPPETGALQPACPVVPGVNMVQCSWSPSLTLTVTAAWVQGDYLLELVGSGGQLSYVPLTVWDPASHATYLVQNSVLTWQAWNTYGGYDFYGGGPPAVSPTYDDRARVVSFDRPYARSYGQGAADFLGEEYPLVRWAEQHGLDVTYGTDITTAEQPALLLDHRVFLSLGHDEQWSLEMRDGVVEALHRGVNLVFFGASPVLRKVRLQASPLGPDRQVVNYRDPEQDPLYASDPSQVSQNQWSQPPADWEPSALVGNTYLGYGIDVPLVVTDASSWLYAGTGLGNGARLPTVIRSDFNGYVPGVADPAGVEILAHSPAVPGAGRTGFADTVYYTDPTAGGGVFSTGTNGWIPAMGCSPSTGAPCPAVALDRMTGNLFELFGSGPAGRSRPSVANWQSYYPG
jgi:hypothetical protein